MKNLIVLFSILALGLAGMSCDSGGDDNDGPGTDTIAPECATDDDCAEGETCNADGECEAAIVEPDCTTDDDCAEGEVCTEAGVCEAEVVEPDCTTDDDCAEGEVCTEAGVCEAEVVEPDCTTDDDCAEGEVCTEAGVCEMDVEPPMGACLNEADGAILGPDEGEAAKAAATDCAMGCIAEPDLEGIVACANPCVIDATGLTEDCAGCYTSIIGCTFVNCLALCAADASSEECTTCMADNGCYDVFYECTGLEAPTE